MDYKKLLPYLLIAVGVIVLFEFVLTPAGKTPHVDHPGTNSLAMIEKVRLTNGSMHVLYRADDMSRPPVLFIPGGPGESDMAYVREFLKPMELDFTMIVPDMIGSGKSFDAKAFSNLSVESALDDLYELSIFLTNRFQKKLHVIGYGYGGFLGALFTKAHPELVKSLSLIGAVIDNTASDRLTYRWALSEASRYQMSNALSEMSAIGEPPYTNSNWIEPYGTFSQWAGYFASTNRPVSVYSTNWLNILNTAQEYTAQDRKNLWTGRYRSMFVLYPRLQNRSLFREAKELPVPVYFFHGIHDSSSDFGLAKSYFQALQAPRKEFYAFTNSGSSPCFEEPVRFTTIYRELFTSNSAGGRP